MKSILITGANGFVGRHAVHYFMVKGFKVRAAVRTKAQEKIFEQAGIDAVVTGDLNKKTLWTDALNDIDIVIHTAARVHQLNDESADPLSAFRMVNTEAVATLLDAILAANVKHFVFLSSIKVNGESTQDRPFSEQDVPAPQDAYAISKYEAEQLIQSKLEKASCAYTILRLPLVYGVGVKANFSRLVSLVRRWRFVPLGGIHNKRSLLYVGNLLEIFACVLGNEKAHNRCYCVSDGDDQSTTALVKEIALACNRWILLLPLPVTILAFLLRAIKRDNLVKRLFGSLEVDISLIKKELAWSPKYTMRQALIEMLKIKGE